MTIENFKLIDFLNQSEDTIEKYMIILRHVKQVKTINKVFHMKLKHVELIKNTLNDGTVNDLITIVSKVQNLKRKKVLDIDIIQFFGVVNSIKEQIEKIVKAEIDNLQPNKINVKWEMVEGSARLAKFGIYNTLESLTGGNMLDFEKYMNKSYSEIFTVLYMRKTATDLQNEMEAIKIKSNV